MSGILLNYEVVHLYNKVSGIKVGCSLQASTLTAWTDRRLYGPTNITYYITKDSDIYRSVVYGFELSRLNKSCQDYCGERTSCFVNNSTGEVECGKCSCYLTPSGTEKCGMLLIILAYTECAPNSLFSRFGLDLLQRRALS